MKYSYLLKNMLMFILLLTSITTILSQAQICSKSNVIIDGHVNINSTSIMSAVGSTFRYCDELKSVSFQLDSATFSILLPLASMPVCSEETYLQKGGIGLLEKGKNRRTRF